MRRPMAGPSSLGEDIVGSERNYAASNEDPDVAPSSEVIPPDAKQVKLRTILPDSNSKAAGRNMSMGQLRICLSMH